MPRATGVIAADHRQDQDCSIVDTVVLDYAHRSVSNVTVTSIKRMVIDIALHGSVRLHTDDLLVLDDGHVVEVVAAPEPLIEARAASLSELARLAWYLGDRHIQAELLPNRIRVRRDAAVESLLTALGAKVTMIEAPFEPEGGAYASSHGHDHDHDHAHDHHHDH